MEEQKGKNRERYIKQDALTSLKKQDDVKPCNKSVFDIETINWIEPYAVGFYDDNKDYTEFAGKDCILQFIEHFLSRKYRGNVCYAHNGGKFDFSFILKELYNKKYQDKYIIEPMRASSRIIKICLKSWRWKVNKKGEKVK